MLVPIFELFYEQKNITKDVSPYVTSIEYTDVEHGESDELQITFEDSEKLHEQLADLRAYFKEQGIKPKETMWAIRAAVTGRTHGADMVAILQILGKERSVRRIKAATK